MRTVIGFLVAAVLVGGFLFRKKSQESVTPATKPGTALVQSTPRPASEHNWPKSALDRVSDVKHQVAEQRKQNQPE